MKEALWQPSESYIKDAGLFQYQSYLAKNYGLSFSSYQELHTWSIENLSVFWESLLKFFSIKYQGSYTEVLRWDPSSEDFTDVRWFDGITLNYTEQLFANRTAADIAIYYTDERDNYQEVSWGELESQVAAVQQYLLAQGIESGDRVAGILSNNIEAIVIFLATNAIGAVWSCCSPDFGDKGIAERFSLIAPKVLFMEMAYQYNGKTFHKESTKETIEAAVHSLRKIVDIHDKEWAAIFDSPAKPLSYEQVPFDHPIWILYSSGTTGTPKAITHRVGGMLLEHLKALAFHQNVKAGEKFLWYTTTGWMMWNYALSSLLCGASLCLFDGAINFNNHQSFWDFVKQVKADHLGAGAAYFSSIHALRIEDYQPKVIGSTGSPLPIPTFENLQQKFPDVQIVSLSGGTDVCSAFLSGCPLLPVYAGELQCRTLGSDIVAFNDQGEEVLNEVGELIIKQPMPSMPLYFWNDKDNNRYKSSYFEDYPGKWAHGDWISIADHGGVVIHGRSDATLNRGGVRIGTAEIYNAVQSVEQVKDSLVITQDHADGSSKMILFLQLTADSRLEEVQPLLKAKLRQDYSPRHVPDFMFEVADIPYTLSGKKLEIPVKKIFSGKAVEQAVSRDVMRNPDSLDSYKAIYDDMVSEVSD